MHDPKVIFKKYFHFNLDLVFKFDANNFRAKKKPAFWRALQLVNFLQAQVSLPPHGYV